MLLPVIFAAAIAIPVPGGLAALAQALGIDPPDRARAVAEIVRVVYGNGRQQELLTHFASTRATAADDAVPLPLSADVWSDAVFGRRIGADELFVAVLSDRSAALLAYGLASLDHETLHFFSTHRALLTDLYKNHAGVFSAFAAGIRIRDEHVVVPGGAEGVSRWEGELRAKVSNPAGFVRALLSASRGRLAYLYDVLAHLDANKTTMSRDRFASLAAVVKGLFSEWDVRKHPFTRPSHDLLALFLRVNDPSADVAALARELLSDTPARGERLDQFAFGQRVFRHDAATADAAAAIRAFRDFPMLMLTLERIGVRSPGIYAALARRAERVGTLDGVRCRIAFIQLQAPIALIDRMRRAGTIDRATAEELLGTLASTPPALWVDRDLRRALSHATSDRIEDAIVRALAGPLPRVPARAISWEGGDYLFDVASTDAARIRRFRQQQGGPPIDTAIELFRLADSLERTAAARVLSLSDMLLADALVSLAYAGDWPDVAGTGRVIRNVARRHDFGFDQMTRAARNRMAWSMPQRTSVGGVGWRLEGAILGLDVGLAPLALRRVGTDALVTPPSVSSTEKATFVESFGLLNPLAFDDRTQAAIAESIANGKRRVNALRETPADIDAVIQETRIDGHRAQALRWAVAHDPQSVASYFSMSDLLSLGGGGALDLSAWGMSARKLVGCLCRMSSPPVGTDALVGRPHLGLLASGVLDLHLRVAVTLHELELPAALTKTVLSAAAQEFFDRVKPSDSDDWLTLARTAQTISRERVEDYLSRATSSGPLVSRR